MAKSINRADAIAKIAAKFDARIQNKQSNIDTNTLDKAVLEAEKIALMIAVNEYWDADESLALIQARIALGEPTI